MNYWIVVVDDEPLSLKNAKNILNEKDMKVSCIKSGADLLRFMEKNEPDLILLDIVMPEMDGFETFKLLRETEEKKGKIPTPVIFVTGEIDSETERAGLKIGASDYIHKPFNSGVLVRRIQNTIINSRTIENLTEEATIDSLTGVLNKSNGRLKAEEMCREKTGALLMMDLDSFKLVNDIYGHETGDRALQAFASVVKNNTREKDLIFRSGGDEFIAFCLGVTEDSGIMSMTERLNEQFLREARSLMGENLNIPLGISIGAVLVPESGRDFEELFNYADAALYKVKQNGKHGVEVFHGSFENAEQPQSDDLNMEISRLTRIVTERDEGSGVYVLGMDSFSWIYRYIARFLKRYKREAMKILFSVESADGKNELHSNEVSDFQKALQKTLRNSDIALQSRSNQFFVLLPELSEKYTRNVIDRIMDEWEKMGHDRNRISYVTEVISFKEEEPEG